MKTIPFFFLILLTCRSHAETAAAASSEFPVELGSARSVATVTSGEFPLDMRDKGGVGSIGSAEFALDTMASADGWVAVTAPASVASGSVSPVLVTWHTGTQTRTVTEQVRWVFLTDPAGNSYFSGGALQAGQVSISTSMTVAAVYETIGGISRQSAPVTITVLPSLQGGIIATRQGISGGMVNFTANVSGGNGTITVRWDTDGDGFDDGIAPSLTMNYGTATGTFSASARITDGAGGEITRTGSITLNKAPVANQPEVTIPDADPSGFELFNGDLSNSTFAFDPSRTNNGLVVIVHGLRSDAKEPWLRDMADAIERRCPAAGRPNIALMDWSRDAKVPAPTSEQSEWIIASLKWGLTVLKRKDAAAAAGAGANATKFAIELLAVRDLGLRNGQLLANWTYHNSRIASSRPINSDAPIHFIGHSAGGFVCAEAARLLKHPGEAPVTATRTPVYVDMVTLLDTPAPPKNHLSSDDKGFPGPGMTQRLISSNFGVLDTLPASQITESFFYSRQNIFKSNSLLDLWSPFNNGHGYAHVWYNLETDPLTGSGHSAFASSPIINPAARIPKPYAPPQAMRISSSNGDSQPSSVSSAYPDIMLTGWETFGSANESSGTWTLTESADAGIWKDLALSQTAATLAFEFHFLTPGDGDFLAVHFGDSPVIYQGLDLPLSRDAWLPAEIPLDLLPTLDGKLVFTLVSRGGVNAQVQLRNIRIIQNEDADYDGLTVDGETLAGSDARNPDSDGDGITDGDEVNLHGTDPNRADSDGDGQSDISELAAGTNPLANGSVLRVTSLSRTAQGGFVLNWSAVSGRTYRVMRTQELGTGNYETLAFSVPATVPTTTYVDLDPPPIKAFYWISVE